MEIKGKGSVKKLEKDKERKDCRKWRIVIQTDGAPVTERFTGTYTQAHERRKALIEELESCETDLTFKEYAEAWAALREKDPDIADATVAKNRTQLNVIYRKFADTLLSELTPSLIQEGLLEIRTDDALSGTYMNQVFVLMKQVLKAARADGLMAKNPMEFLKAPKKDTKERSALTRGQLVGFLDAADSLPLDAHIVAILVAVLAGLRRGEVCALQWGDVEAGTISVRRSLQVRGMKLKEPKSASGIRDVPMVARLAKVLGRWKRAQAAQMDIIGLEQGPQTFVCASAVGTIMHPENLNRWWRKNRGKFGLGDVTVHEMRHTFLTLLAAGGADAFALKSIAGWANVSMADVYVHADMDADRRAVAALDTILGSPVVPEKVPAVVPLN